MPETVFISYRQGDAPYARAVQTALDVHLSGETVFRDVSSIRPGDDLRAVIPSQLERSTVVLALIGPSWAQGDSGRPPLSHPDDWVRFELSLALAWRKTILPVLLGGAGMPERHLLPQDVRALTDILAVQVRDTDWDHDIARLLDAIDPSRSASADRSSGSGSRLADVGPVAGGDISIVGDVAAGRDLDLGRREPTD